MRILQPAALRSTSGASEVYERSTPCARDWLNAAAREPVTTSTDSYLFHGAPALAYVLSRAAAGQAGGQRTPALLNQVVTRQAEERRGTGSRNYPLGGCCPALKIPMWAAFTVPMWWCVKAPLPWWLRGFGGGAAGGCG